MKIPLLFGLSRNRRRQEYRIRRCQIKVMDSVRTHRYSESAVSNPTCEVILVKQVRWRCGEFINISYILNLIFKVRLCVTCAGVMELGRAILAEALHALNAVKRIVLVRSAASS